jgi:hypothetical protein
LSARRFVAGADRAKENVEKVRKLIEEFYGLRAEYGQWYEDIKPQAVEIKLLSPTGQQVARFEVYRDEGGYVLPRRLGGERRPRRDRGIGDRGAEASSPPLLNYRV